MDSCIFCQIVRKKAHADIVEENSTVVIFTPLDPHAPGHVLVVPKVHVKHALHNPAVTGTVMTEAAIYAHNNEIGACNILTSVGEVATQSVFHLHVHVIPRGGEDGLYHDWPWMRERGAGKA